MTATMANSLATSEITLSLSSSLFTPLEYINLSSTYDRFSVPIDLLIYALIFLGIAKVTLGKRFEGKGGQAICAGVGIALAIGMTIAEQRYGFNLQDFGPAAATTLILLFSIMIYETLRYVGIGKARSAALAYLVTFLILLGVAPGIFDWLSEKAPFLALVIILATLLAILALLSGLLPHGYSKRGFERAFKRAKSNDPVHAEDRVAMEKEKRYIKKQMRPTTKKTESTLHNLGSGLKNLRKTLRRKGLKPEQIPKIKKNLRDVAENTTALKEQIRALRTFAERLKTFDTKIYTKKQQEQIRALSPNAKTLIAKEIRDEVERLEVENKANRVEEIMEHHMIAMDTAVNEAIAAMECGKADTAMAKLKKAEDAEKAMQDMAHLIRRLQDYLLALVKGDIRIEKKLIAE